MNQTIFALSDVYLDNMHQRISIVLWIGYIILNLYYLFYLKSINCDCYNLKYRTFIIIFSLLSFGIIFSINRNEGKKEKLIVYLALLLLCDIILTYNIRKLIINVQKDKCYCGYTHNNIFDIHSIVKYLNLFNILGIIISILMAFYIFIKTKI